MQARIPHFGKPGTGYWNRIKCKERCGNLSEAVIGHATINIDSWVWKSLEDSLPKLYCADFKLRLMSYLKVQAQGLCVKERYDTQSPNQRLHQKPLAKRRNGKQTQYWGNYQGPTNVSCLGSNHNKCQKHWAAHTMYYLGVPTVWENRTRHQIPMQPRKAHSSK
jgi:hypothetical protein